MLLLLPLLLSLPLPLLLPLPLPLPLPPLVENNVLDFVTSIHLKAQLIDALDGRVKKSEVSAALQSEVSAAFIDFQQVTKDIAS